MWPLYFLLVMSAVACCAFGIDKLCACCGWRRIPESGLLALCLLGGAPGAAVGMLLFHHKVSKAKFRYVVPLLAICTVAAGFIIFKEVIV